MAKFLVTGAAGFIGAQVAQQLLAQGSEVVGLDNLNTYYDPRLKTHRLQRLQAHPQFSPQFSFVQADIEHKPALDQLFSQHKFEAVINLAARAGVRASIEDPFVYLATNALGTLNLLELMRHHGPAKMVLASTSSLYAGMPLPFNEELAVNTPLSPYAASKKAAEVMAYSYHHLFKLDISVVRYFTVYGPAGRPDMSIFRFIRWIDQGQPIELFGDGSQTRDFTYVDDIAAGTIAAARPLGYEIINLGGGRRPVALNEIISILENLLGKKAVIERKPFHSADMKETGADISKAKRLLDWEPRIDVDQGLRRCVEWYQQNKALASAIAL
jgi:UDP-glucuronate 4-epimerase